MKCLDEVECLEPIALLLYPNFAIYWLGHLGKLIPLCMSVSSSIKQGLDVLIDVGHFFIQCLTTGRH